MHVVLGKAASSLDKNIDPLDCKVINSLIENQDSSSTDRVFPLLLKQGVYQEDCTSRVGQLPSLVKGPLCPRLPQLSVVVRLFISVKAGSYSKRGDGGTRPVLGCVFFSSLFSPSFTCTFVPSFYFSCAATTTNSSVHPLPPSLHTSHFIQLASSSIEGP